jgi:hypothetical protein
MHCDANPTLEAAANIVAVPRNTLGHARVDAGSRKVAPNVSGSRSACSQKYDEANKTAIAQ